MPVPTQIRPALIPAPFLRRRMRVLPLLLGLLTLTAHAAKRRPAEYRFELDKLGYPGISASLLAQGGTLLTVHFAGDNHLLLTYATRGLIPRLPNDRAGDEDRMVAALLIELPSGKVVARTDWRLHDRSRYLWSLGHGRFLLRIQDSLSTLNPVANLGTGHAFERTVFGPTSGRIDAIVVTPDHELITVESSQPLPEKSPARIQAALTAAKLATRPHFASDAQAAPAPTPFIPPDEPTSEPVRSSAETYSIFHINGVGTIAAPIESSLIGHLTVASIVALPLFLDGYLKDSGQDRSQWNVDFHAFSGKNYMFAPIDSSCAPSLYRVGPAQFLSVNCRGMTGNVTLAAYDLAQHEMWEESLPDSIGAPSYATAPLAGRFAISRIVPSDGTRSPGVPLDQPPDITSSQEVRIYQTQSGDLLLKIECTPAFKALENFDLAPDGLHAVVIREGAIEVHRLPPLTRQDRDDLAALAPVTPPESKAGFDLRAFAGTSEQPMPSAASGGPAVPAATSLPANAVVVQMGDVPTERPAPTLLKPDEKPEFVDKVPPSR
jgi:hypothetical protein